MAYLVFGCRCLLLVVFVAAAVGKLRAFPAFRRATRQLGVPEQLAVVVIVAEVATAALLAWRAAAGFAASIGLLAAFTAVIVLRRNSKVSCRCFGTSAPLGTRHVVRNAGLLAIAATGLVADLVRTSVPANPLGLVIAATAAATAAALVISFDAIVDLYLGPVEGIAS